MQTPRPTTKPIATVEPSRKMTRRGLLLLILLALIPPAQAKGLVFESPTRQVAVLELFTSHGCSSCPPADAWLRKLVNHPGLWKQVIPLSLHVDYWDGLGWPDRFARAEFSARQRAYRHTGGLSSVYTPGFLLNGHEWRDWFSWRSRSASTLPEFPLGREVGKLHLEVIPGDRAQVRFNPLTEYGPLRAHLAILGFGLTTPIGGGENSGRTLKEDFVVLGTTRTEPASGVAPYQWNVGWPELLTADEAKRHAVVVWISEGDNPRPIQAIGGWLP